MQCTWLLSSVYPSQPTLAYGLSDTGMGLPEIGFIDLAEISRIKSRFGDHVQADKHFQGKFPLSVYTQAAVLVGQIVEAEPVLAQFTTPTQMKG